MAVTKRDYVLPSAMVSENYYGRRDEPDFIAAKVQKIVDGGYYRAVEINNPLTAGARRRIARAVGSPGSRVKHVTWWLSHLIFAEKLDLNATDEAERQRAVRAVTRALESAPEMHADGIGIVSGPQPGILQRSSAYAALMKSIETVAAAAAALKMRVLLEPMDCNADRCRLAGFTRDVAELCGLLRDCGNVRVTLDTAHAALNREDPETAVGLVREYVGGVHLANAVLTPRSPLYGDRHLAPGRPGFLDAPAAQRVLQAAWQAGICRDDGLCVGVEYRQPADGDGGEDRTCEAAADFLKQTTLEFMLAA